MYFADGIAHQLRRAAQAANRTWQQRHQDLTTPQFAVLAEPDQAPLGRLASIDKSTLATLVDRLDERGLISNIIDPANRRRRQIQLTEAGRERCTLAYYQVVSTRRWITEVLGGTNAHQLRTLLQNSRCPAICVVVTKSRPGSWAIRMAARSANSPPN